MMSSTRVEIIPYEEAERELAKPKRRGKKLGRILRTAREAATDGFIHCWKCGRTLEPDSEKCSCGWRNPLPYLGYI